MNAVVSENLPATTVTAPPAQLPARVMSEGESAFALAQRKAQAYARSSLVPKDYWDNVPNVLIAMEIAQRIGANELMVMQNLYIVHGRPGWSAPFLIATVNACKRFTPLRFETRGDDPNKDDYRVRAYAEDVRTGEKCVGAWITWAMVKAEDWLSKKGSKWKTMPEQMFMYRAASFWTRVYAPEVSMGIRTSDEIDDIVAAVPGNFVPRTEHNNLRQLEAQLTGREPEPEPESPDVLARGALRSAETIDELNLAYEAAEGLPGVNTDALLDLYNERAAALETQE